MRARLVEFGEVELDGQRYRHDVVVERGRVTRRHEGASKSRRDEFGHTPLTMAEAIPWHCRRLIVGTGAGGALPIAAGVLEEAARRGVEAVAVPSREACRLLTGAGRRPVRGADGPGMHGPPDRAVGRPWAVFVVRGMAVLALAAVAGRGGLTWA